MLIPWRYQLNRADRQRLRRDTDGDELTLGRDTADRRCHGTRVARGSQHDRRTAQGLQRFGGIARGGVDVVMGAEFPRIVLFAGAPVDRDGLEAHRPGELHSQVTEAADAEDRHPVAGHRLGVAQGVIGGHAGAAQWGGFCVGELGRYPGQRTGGHSHRLGISARILPARDFAVLAVNELAFAALIAVIAAPAEPPDRDTIADRETLDARPEFGDCSGDFMPGSQRPRHAGESARNKVGVGAADPARGHRQPCLITTRGFGFDVDQL